MATTTNKLFLIFKDSEDKDVVISFSKVKPYSVEFEEKALIIAQSFLTNRACLNLSIYDFKELKHSSENETTIVDNRDN